MSVRESYLQHLLKMNEITREEADAIAEIRQAKLEREFELAQQEEYVDDLQTMGGYWQGYYGGAEPEDDAPETFVSEDTAREVLKGISSVPADFNVHRKLKRLLTQREEMSTGSRPLDWAGAEALALGKFTCRRASPFD